MRWKTDQYPICVSLLTCQDCVIVLKSCVMKMHQPTPKLHSLTGLYRSCFVSRNWRSNAQWLSQMLIYKQCNWIVYHFIPWSWQRMMRTTNGWRTSRVPRNRITHATPLTKFRQCMKFYFPDIYFSHPSSFGLSLGSFLSAWRIDGSISARPSTLHTISLAYFVLVDDSTVMAMVSNCPALTQVDLTKTAITDESCAQLALLPLKRCRCR